jgi:hypothetical protein
MNLFVPEMILEQPVLLHLLLLERTDIRECPLSYPLPLEGSIFWISSKTAIFILIVKKQPWCLCALLL